jgi:hypothetical protein
MNDSATHAQDSRDRSRQISLVVAAFAISAGLALRFYNLDLKGLWLDEIYALYPLYSLDSIERLFADYLVIDPTPPFFELVLLAWINLFGYTDFAVRALTAVLGFSSVVACFFMVRWVFGLSAAVTATILIAFSWPAIFYSQEVRAYSLVLLMAIFVTAFWLQILLHRQSGAHSSRPYWALVILAPVLSFAHLYGFIFAAFLWIYLFAADLFRRDPLAARWSAFGFFITNLAFLPWLAINMRAMADSEMLDLTPLDRPGASFFVDVGAFMYHHPIPALLLGLGPILLGSRRTFPRIWTAFRARNLNEPLLGLICVIVIPFVAVFVFSQFKPILYTRYLMVFVPAGIFFTALAFEEWRQQSPWRRHVALLAVAVISLAWILPDHYRYRSKPQTREAVQFILESFDPATDLVWAPCQVEAIFSSCDYSAGALSPRLSRYVHYLNYDSLPEISIRPESFATPEDAYNQAQHFQNEGTKTIFLIGSRSHLGQLPDGTKALLEAGFHCIETKFFMSAVYTCQRD